MSVSIRFVGNPVLEKVIRGRVPLRQAVEGELKPSAKLMSVIGEELIQGFRGSTRITYIKISPRGGLTYSRSSLYPSGIWRGVSPNGAEYRPLSPATIQLKKREGSRYPNTPLIDTRELVNNLRYRVLNGNAGVTVFFNDAEIARRSLLLDRGGNVRSESLASNSRKADTSMRVVEIPARPHRDVQPAVVETIRRLLRKWAEHKKVI